MVIGGCSTEQVSTTSPPGGQPGIESTAPEDRLAEVWPELLDLWNEATAYRAEGVIDDEFIRLTGRVDRVFASAGFYGERGGFETGALKEMFRIVLRTAIRERPKDVRLKWRVIATTDPQSKPLPGEVALVVSVRGSTKNEKRPFSGTRLTTDQSPAWVRVRMLALANALVKGDAYPHPTKPDADMVRKTKSLIREVRSDDRAQRDAATKKMMSEPDLALSLLRGIAKAEDAELRSRIQLVLGIGHTPWEGAESQVRGNFNVPTRRAPVGLSVCRQCGHMSPMPGACPTCKIPLTPTGGK